MAPVWKKRQSLYQKFCPPNLKRVPTPMLCPPPSLRSTSAHNNTTGLQKRIGDLITIQVKKGIAGRNAIHFGTRNVDWECNPFKKDFTDAWQ